MSNNNSNQNLTDKIATNIGRFIGRWIISFMTPFFAIYNCHKLMKEVESEYLKLFIFIISIIYVATTLFVAIYICFKNFKN